MRILYLNHNVIGGGTYQRVRRIAAEAAARGHDPTLVTTRRAGGLSGAAYMDDGVRVIEAPDLLVGGARQGWDPYNTAWRIARLARERFDLIHGFDCRPAVIGPALALRRISRAPLVLDWADWWGRGGTIQVRSGWAVRTLFGPIETWFEESFRGTATAHTTISDALRDRCIRLGVPAERVMTLPNGCPRAQPQQAGERAAARRELGIGPAVPLILHLGNIQPPDAELMFSAFRAVLELLPSARLALIGYKWPIPGDLKAHSVIDTGYIESDSASMRRWLAAADAGVVPLRDNIANRARWPSKVNDYMAHGLPVLVTDIGPAAAYVQRHGAGIQCRPEVDALAAAMVDMTCNEAARSAMSAAAVELAAGELCWAPIVDSLFRFYEKWLASPAAPTRYARALPRVMADS